MGTKATISYVCENGQIETISCSNDGCPEHMGLVLPQFFANQQAVHELINLGDIAYIDEENGRVEAYHRDRKENYGDVRSRIFFSKSQWMLDIDACFALAAYHYLWDGVWKMKEADTETLAPLVIQK